jgi:hypothetical protein
MNKAIGAKCYFENIYVNGVLKNDYSPLKGEKIKNKLKLLATKPKLH